MIAFIERLLELRFKFNITRDYVRRRHSFLTLLKKNIGDGTHGPQTISGGVGFVNFSWCRHRDRHVRHSTQKRRYT
jgi:hypothetical protein